MKVNQIINKILLLLFGFSDFQNRANEYILSLKNLSHPTPTTQSASISTNQSSLINPLTSINVQAGLMTEKY